MTSKEFVIDDCYVASAIVLTTNQQPTIKFNPTIKKAVFIFENTKAVNEAFQSYMAGSPLKVYADLTKTLRTEALKLKTRHS